jgi:hypothetical protein
MFPNRSQQSYHRPRVRPMRPPAPKRYPWWRGEKKLTIAAGFVCTDGIILCTDSQYTGWEKTHNDKLFLRSHEAGIVSFVPIGDEDHCKTAIEDGMQAVEAIPLERRDLWNIRKALRRATKSVVDDYRATGLEESQAPRFLIGISTATEMNLFLNTGSAFSPIQDCDFQGTASYLAKYIVGTVGFDSKSASVSETFPLALKVVSAAKRHDTNCGGGSQFIAMKGGHRSTRILTYNLDETDQHAREFNRLSTSLFCDLGKPNFDAILQNFDQNVAELRDRMSRSDSPFVHFQKSLSQLG